MAADGSGLDWAAAAGVVRALGGPDCGSALLRAAGALLAVDHLSLFRFGGDLAPHLVLAASACGSGVAAEAGRRYQAGRFHRFDPNMGHLQAGSRPGKEEGEPLILRLSAASVPDGAYRASIYDRFDLGERLSLIDRMEGRWLALNLYRQRARAACTGTELDRLRLGAGFLTAAAGRHAALVAPAGVPAGPATVDAGRPADASGLLENLLRAERLSPREAQVCGRALIGMTNLGIALDLGVKESTVATLRRRAYAKLGITGIQELFLLCLRRLFGNGGSADRGAD